MRWRISDRVGDTMQVFDRILALGARRVVEDTPFGVTPAPAGATVARPGKGQQELVDSSKPPARRQRLDPRTALLQRQCLKLAMSIFASARSQVRSLGFTSAVAGEGKTFLSSATAAALAKKANRPVVLVDCNWEHPSLHALYNLPDSPGLAEWTRGECNLSAIRHQVAPHLCVIPAGLALGDAINITSRLASQGIASLLSEPNEVMVADLPPVLTSAYGAQIAHELDAVTLVVRAHTTWDTFVAEAYHELEDAQVEGVILNATQSRIPRWIQRIM